MASNAHAGRKGDSPAEMEEASSYSPEKCCRIAVALARLGNASDADIAEALDVSVSTLNLWRDLRPEFADALKSPPSKNDDAVARALLSSALGYDYKTDKVIDTREGPVVRNVKVHSPPSVEALEFLLRARMPKVYGHQAKVAKGADYKFIEALDRLKAGKAPAPSTMGVIDEDILLVAHVMARLLASDDEIAEGLGISVDEFKGLAQRHLELSEALKSAKEFIDAALEKSLTQRALGYLYIEEELFCSREGDIVRTLLRKHLPPDRKAQDLWGLGLEVRSAKSGAGKKSKGS